MLVCSPLLTSHKWRELVSSGRLVCSRCHDVFLYCYYVSFLLLRFRLYALVEAAALRSIVLRYAGAPVDTYVSFFFSLLFIWTCRFFRVCFAPFPLSLCMDCRGPSYVLSFRMVFFYLVTTGWIFEIRAVCDNTINKKNMHYIYSPIESHHFGGGFVPIKNRIGSRQQ